MVAVHRRGRALDLQLFGHEAHFETNLRAHQVFGFDQAAGGIVEAVLADVAGTAAGQLGAAGVTGTAADAPLRGHMVVSQQFDREALEADFAVVGRCLVDVVADAALEREFRGDAIVQAAVNGDHAAGAQVDVAAVGVVGRGQLVAAEGEAGAEEEASLLLLHRHVGLGLGRVQGSDRQRDREGDFFHGSSAL